MVKQRSLGRWAVLLAIGLFLILAHRLFLYTPDDAFITFRYARNLAEGYGPVFNRQAPFADRTEGYSCPLYLFLLAALLKLPLGLDLLFRAKFLGLACALATLWLLPRLAQRLGLPVWAQAVAPLLLAAHTSFVVTSVNAMETLPMAFLVTLAAYLFLATWAPEEAARPGRAIASRLLFAACALMRPEGLLFGIAGLGVLLYRNRGRLNKEMGLWLLALLVPVFLFLLWRKGFYGLWLPNTFYAKVQPFMEAAPAGATQLFRTFFAYTNTNWIYLFFAGFWWMLIVAGCLHPNVSRPPGLVLPLLVAAQALFLVRSGGDWMGGWRFMAPVVPLMTLLSVAGIAHLQQELERSLRGGHRLLHPVLAFALSGLLLFACLWGHRDYWRDTSGDYGSWSSVGFSLAPRQFFRQNTYFQLHQQCGDWIQTHLPPGAVIAYTEMGFLPYFTPDHRYLDVAGLTDHGVATLPDARRNATFGIVADYKNDYSALGRYLATVRTPDYIMELNFKQSGVTPRQAAILDGAYVYLESISLTDNSPDRPLYIQIWKRQTTRRQSEGP